MRKGVVYSSRARQDLLDIWLWIAESSGAQSADRILDRMEERLHRLAAFPEMGPARPGIAPRARVLVIQRWLALYAIDDHEIRIVRIVDSAVDTRRISWEE
ncbi:toxin ParE1/3/4 [Neorhizobium huautlense]|uniref:Toxin ParE1/3/4 n=1 Tax=Neorhizobium huautlense TaxID=67774 RepID=A0ABT9PYF8_9HYPH|nr:type II toxin-antitoxin system RelE/ParE family toxin [Neorhizobium huautlense]MDP9839530.1 toxin ParE1/3/4 [Neorhizobium huautlense]